MALPQLAAFARLAKENVPPTRVLEGQKTRISRTMHAFSYDAIHDEIVVSSPLAQAVLTFRGAAQGEEPPIRILQGPRTGILGVNDKVSVDPVHGEIYVPIWPNSVLVFDREAQGDVAPKRVLQLPATSDLNRYQESVGAAYVDPVNDLLFAAQRGSLFVFDRTASGNAKPKAVISGATGHFQIAPSGWVIGACGEGAVCAWSIQDALKTSDVAPRWKIPVQQLTGYGAAGIALDPVHKELIFSAAAREGGPTVRNAIITFSWPEIF